MPLVLIALPGSGFDPTEASVPWRVLRQQGHQIIVATPDGREARADPRLLTGQGLGIVSPFLKADRNARAAYEEMVGSREYREPIAYPDIDPERIDGLILPGGHAPGVRPYLESARLQGVVGRLFEKNRPVGAICHGVLIPARARRSDGRSVLYGRKVTALPRLMELTGWLLTYPYLGNYLRTYPVPVEDEIRAALAARADFLRGPPMMFHDSPQRLQVGFTVRDGNFLSARWPGDAHRFAHDFAALMEGASKVGAKCSRD